MPVILNTFFDNLSDHHSMIREAVEKEGAYLDTGHSGESSPWQRRMGDSILGTLSLGTRNTVNFGIGLTFTSTDPNLLLQSPEYLAVRTVCARLPTRPVQRSIYRTRIGWQRHQTMHQWLCSSMRSLIYQAQTCNGLIRSNPLHAYIPDILYSLYANDCIGSFLPLNSMCVSIPTDFKFTCPV